MGFPGAVEQVRSYPVKISKAKGESELSQSCRAALRSRGVNGSRSRGVDLGLGVLAPYFAQVRKRVMSDRSINGL